MKIIICGSISSAKNIIKVKKALEKSGHEVEIPEGVKNILLRRTKGSSKKKSDIKIRHDLIKGYYEKMKSYDVVLIVNPPRKGIPGYIGGNTLIEMAFALILNKKLYCLYPLPDLPYTSEILAMQPIVLDEDLKKIK